MAAVEDSNVIGKRHGLTDRDIHHGRTERLMVFLFSRRS